MKKKIKPINTKSPAFKFNQISKKSNALFTVIFLLIALSCIIPLVFVIIISFTHKDSIAEIGYSFFPKKWTLDAYKYLWDSRVIILKSFAISIFVTVFGTLLGLFLNSTMGYVLSRRNFKFKKLYTYIVFIPMVFNGGMVANYLVMTKLLDLKNNILALILPIAVASFYVIILRTFFTTTIPDSIIESGKIDGAGQIRIFYTLVLPISLPAIATIGLFLSFSYWNDWFHALMYLNERDLFPLQYVLIQIEKNIEFMASGSSHLGISASEILAKMPAESTKMALVVLAVIPIAASYPFFQKYFVSGLTVGAVKG
ncbi:MAG: carbohydrate ABC transporter permease [Oscillospiraceae bacterium]